MSKIGIIANGAFVDFANMQILQRENKKTPYGELGLPLIHALLQGIDIVIVQRNNASYNTPPHLINYRANIQALYDSGVDYILSISPVNGIRADMTPGVITIPEQIIDYTYDRKQTFFEDDFTASYRVDFRNPYNDELRDAIIQFANQDNIPLVEDVTYAVIQGPRQSSLAEINRIERDGGDIIGMTGMPEAILAKELSIPYLCISLVTHKAAGRRCTMMHSYNDIGSTIRQSLENIHLLISKFILGDPRNS